jgi:lycopene cyclase domain-containing protein
MLKYTDYKWRKFEEFLMISDQYTYLFLNTITILGPLALSFDKKVAFYKSWKNFGISMIVTSTIYILWDIWFTKINVWAFNPKYVIGSWIASLPLEEYLFFIIIPYACLFIYACLKAYLPNFSFKKSMKPAMAILLACSLWAIVLNPTHLYTTVTFGFLFITLAVLWATGNTQNLSHILLAWIIALIPMAYVNGVLTGKPVLIYNNAQNLGIRIGTIPMEDFFYNMVYMLWMILIYEFLNKKISKNTSNNI